MAKFVAFSQHSRQVALSSSPLQADYALALHDVTMMYADGTVALEPISFALQNHEFVAIVGPSGCGKSTLLRIISGLLQQSSGRVQVNRDKLGFTFQEPTLMPWRNVQKNVEVLLELRGIARQERQKLAKAQLKRMGLADVAHFRPHQLSGGMKMRVSLARSLALEPDIFLLDEPFGSLDEITRQKLNQELLELFGQEAFAALLVTHSIREAVFMASRVLVMSARPGKIVAEIAVPFGYPRAEKLRYTSDFAQLCGTIYQHLHDAS